ncbi:MAG: hypothetical protein AAGU74_06710 [Bacillota bacterium]
MKRRRITILIATLLCAGLLVGFVYPFIAKIAQSQPKATATPAQVQSLNDEEIPLADPEEDTPTAAPASTPSATPAPTATQKPRRTADAPTPTQAVPVEPGTTVVIEDDPIPIAVPED